MTHIQITARKDGSRSLVIDGVDCTKKVLAQGFEVSGFEDVGPANVHLVVPADVLDVDLPDVVVSVLRAKDEASEDYAASIGRDNEALREMNATLRRLEDQQRAHHGKSVGHKVAKRIDEAAAAAKNHKRRAGK